MTDKISREDDIDRTIERLIRLLNDDYKSKALTSHIRIMKLIVMLWEEHHGPLDDFGF